MSLRWRLCLALAALAAVATLVTTSVAYSGTRHRLAVEVDRFLVDRVAAAAAMRDRPNPERRRVRTMVEELLTGDARLQLLDGAGVPLDRVGTAELPVDEVDVAMAAAGGGPSVRLRTVQIDGEPYRLATRGLPGQGAVQLARSLSEPRRVLDALRWRFTVLGLLVVAGAALVGLLIARRLTRDLEELTAAAEHVAGTGDLSVPIRTATGRSDEAGRLARAMATMLDALDRSRRQQRDLVQDASHELRTPITSLRTNIDVLARYPDLAADQRAAVVAELRAEMVELGTLVDELVAGAADPGEAEEPATLSLAEVVGHAAARVGRRHGRRVEVVGWAGRVWAPPVGLARAVTNLLENAVKFSPPGTDVVARLDGGRLEVTDAGPGVAPEDAERIFDRFYRSPSSRTLPGSGLGLAIVRQVVEGAGGEVFVVPATGGADPAGGAAGPPPHPAIGFVLPLLDVPSAPVGDAPVGDGHVPSGPVGPPVLPE